MDQSDQARVQATILTRALEGIATKLKEDRGLSDEQIGLALMASALNTLSRAWSGRELVDHLSGVTAALMDVHGIQPDGEVAARSRPN